MDRYPKRLVVVMVFISLGLGGCTSNSALVQRGLFKTNSATLEPAGNYHLVTYRERVSGDLVFCSEPSPDWATAFGSALSGALSGGVSSGPSGNLAANYATTQSITAMLGRTAGVVALRDGLYAACQAYANRIIGKDSYLLILSQYGNLLVALTAGSGGSGGSTASGGQAPSATPSGVAVAVSTGTAAAPAARSDTTSSNSQDASTNVDIALKQQEAIQAMIVSCIGSYDKSVPDNPGNPILSEIQCRSLMQAIVNNTGTILTAGIATQKPNNNPTVVPKADPAVKKIQASLNSEGEHLTVDGIMGPETEQAILRHSGVSQPSK